jgi:hypothetical protein
LDLNTCHDIQKKDENPSKNVQTGKKVKSHHSQSIPIQMLKPKREEKSKKPMVVLIALFAILVVYAALSGTKQAEVNVPLYPGAKEYQKMNIEQFMQVTDRSLPNDWSGKIHTVPGTVGDVIGWYQTQMEGWIRILDQKISLPSPSEGHMLAFIGQGNGVLIVSYDVPEIGTVLGLFSGPASSWT